MPEQVALMKLRGFVHDLGGEVVESQPGLIRVQLPSPTSDTAAAPKGFLGWFRSPPPPPPSRDETIELHFRKRPSGGRSLVNILVIRVAPQLESRAQREAGVEQCRRVCNELRAYLMIGR